MESEGWVTGSKKSVVCQGMSVVVFTCFISKPIWGRCPVPSCIC